MDAWLPARLLFPRCLPVSFHAGGDGASTGSMKLGASTKSSRSCVRNLASAGIVVLVVCLLQTASAISASNTSGFSPPALQGPTEYLEKAKRKLQMASLDLVEVGQAGKRAINQIRATGDALLDVQATKIYPGMANGMLQNMIMVDAKPPIRAERAVYDFNRSSNRLKELLEGIDTKKTIDADKITTALARDIKQMPKQPRRLQLALGDRHFERIPNWDVDMPVMAIKSKPKKQIHVPGLASIPTQCGCWVYLKWGCPYHPKFGGVHMWTRDVAGEKHLDTQYNRKRCLVVRKKDYEVWCHTVVKMHFKGCLEPSLLALRESPESILPRTPGCFYSFPRGCSTHNIAARSWRRDVWGQKHLHSHLREAVCTGQRRMALNAWCRTRDVKMHFNPP
eukprot:TRINITY_DN57764_c0_g1_i1.p1 TRINITY_DN57764_c0_g1~~TRINITY_DN57764_c0_g1_i1.p1  ORF type:complete len:394 (-),score=40.67 TRINITY_DN57764_c0_g1_i1:66-1247(-)